MSPLVVLFALASVACASLVPLAQPPHHPAIVLDPHGRPLDTAEVIGARALHLQAKALEGHHYGSLAHAPLVHAAPLAYSVAAPAAVSHQSRVDVISSPAVVSHAVASPYLGHAAYGLAGHGHYLHKRSLGHYAYSAPAVSHQARVDVISSPAVVSHAVAAPVASYAVAAPVYAAPVATTYVGGSAVSHQSRLDVRATPAVVSHSVVAAPVGYAHSAYYGAGWGHSHDHLLKKRSLALAHAVLPAAISHQSRIDVISKQAAPVVVGYAAPVAVAHAVPAAVSHQSRVHVISSAAYVAPLAHSTVWTAPAHYAYSGLFHSSPLAYASHW